MMVYRLVSGVVYQAQENYDFIQFIQVFNNMSSQQDNVEDLFINSDSEDQLKRHRPLNVQNPKKKRFKHNIYEEQAEVDDDEESFYDESAQLNRKQQQKLKNQCKSYQPDYNKISKRKDNKMNQILNMKEKEIIERYEEGDFKQIGDQQACGRSSNDPKLFALQVVNGKQNSLCLQILNKASYFAKEENTLKIFSALVDELRHPGMLFVEAFNIGDIRKSLEGFENMRLGRIQQLKQDKISQLLFMKKQVYTPRIKKGDLVRIVDGLYQNDLAKVNNIKITQKNQKVQVILVPRIDIAQIQRMAKNAIPINFKKMKYAKSNNRPSAKPLNPHQLPSIKQIEKLRITRQGFIQQIYPLNKLKPATNISPKQLLVFRDPKSDVNQLEYLENQIKNVRARGQFEIGQKVKVISGDFKNLKGTVESIQGGTGLGPVTKIIVRPSQKDLKPFEISGQQIIKYFKQSEHIQVIQGKHKGKTGYILRIKQSSAIVYTDNGNQIEVLLSQMTLSNAKRLETQKEIARYELVKMLGSGGVGVVLSNQKNNLKLLDVNNTIKVVSMLDIEQKVNSRFFTAKNEYGHQIKEGAMVKIKEGIYSNKICEVKHVYKEHIFIMNKDFYHSMGIIAEKVNNTILYTPSQKFQKLKPLYGEHKKQYTEKKNNPKNQDEMQIGKTVLIKTGQWKGYQGVIKKYIGDLVQLKLSAQFRVVRIKKQAIEKQKDPLDFGKTPRYGGGQTVYGQSPGRFGSTPNRPYGDYD